MDTLIVAALSVLPMAIGVWLFYLVVKAAVRNGILEAQARSRSPKRPYANLTDDELKARLAAHEARGVQES